MNNRADDERIGRILTHVEQINKKINKIDMVLWGEDGTSGIVGDNNKYKGSQKTWKLITGGSLFGFAVLLFKFVCDYVVKN